MVILYYIYKIYKKVKLFLLDFFKCSAYNLDLDLDLDFGFNLIGNG